MPILAITMPRSRRSRCRSWRSRCPDPGDHDAPIPVITIAWRMHLNEFGRLSCWRTAGRQATFRQQSVAARPPFDVPGSDLRRAEWLRSWMTALGRDQQVAAAPRSHGAGAQACQGHARLCWQPGAGLGARAATEPCLRAPRASRLRGLAQCRADLYLGALRT
jgi:hypothetical protein